MALPSAATLGYTRVPGKAERYVDATGNVISKRSLQKLQHGAAPSTIVPITGRAVKSLPVDSRFIREYQQQQRLSGNPMTLAQVRKDPQWRYYQRILETPYESPKNARTARDRQLALAKRGVLIELYGDGITTGELRAGMSPEVM